MSLRNFHFGKPWSRLTLAVGLVGVVPAVVCAVADPRRVDAQRGGVAADEIFLFHPQLVKVRAVGVV